MTSPVLGSAAGSILTGRQCCCPKISRSRANPYLPGSRIEANGATTLPRVFCSCMNSGAQTVVEEAVSHIPAPSVIEWQKDANNIEELNQFQELCSGALEMLELLLKSKASWQHVQAAVYCRSPETYDTGELLFKLAKNMHLVGEDSITDVNNFLYLGGAQEEGFLAKNEFLELPNKGCSVFPLTRGLHVVGLLLLVLEHPGNSSKSIDSNAPSDKSALSVFLEREIDVLSSVKKILASACDLYQSTFLLRATSIARTKYASGLLTETKGPVKFVRSMANMLYYRVPSGDPEKDMVQTIKDQGARLSEVVNQLETVLNLPDVPYIECNEPILQHKKLSRGQ